MENLTPYYISSIVPHVMNCTMELYSHINDTGVEEWMYITNNILYYGYPCVLLLALISCLFSTIASAKMVTDSHECYFTAFNVSSLILTIITIVTQIPFYFTIPEGSHFYDLLAYFPAAENWCWYCCTWSLFAAVIERAGHALCGRWHASFGRVHGILASMLVVVICFVCTLPQYWEYQLSHVMNSHGDHNCSRVVFSPRDTILKPEGGYVKEYYYFNWIILVFSIGLPYLIMPILLPLMCCVKMHSYTALSPHGNLISTYTDDYAINKDEVKDERSFNRLLATIVLLYLIMSGPRNAVKLLHSPPLFLSFCENSLLSDTLILLFDVAFYLQFAFLFLVSICMSDKFTSNLKFLLCKRCYTRRS